MRAEQGNDNGISPREVDFRGSQRSREEKCSFTQFWHNGVFVKYGIVIVDAFPSFLNSDSSSPRHDAFFYGSIMALSWLFCAARLEIKLSHLIVGKVTLSKVA